MIEKLKFKFGAGHDAPQLEVDMGAITIFVGPNNSGKSKVLVEIENFCRNGFSQPGDLILENLTFSPMTKEQIEFDINQFEQTPVQGEIITPGNIIIGKVNSQTNSTARIHINKENLIREAQNPNQRLGTYAGFLNLFILRLDGSNRLYLLNEQDAGDLQTNSKNILAHVFNDTKVRYEIRRIIKEAFDKYLVIDPTNIGKFRVRLSDTEPITESIEKGWGVDSVAFHKMASLISDFSDGVKAFAGIVTTVLAGNPKVTLIDEPEAFLHPALANSLAKEVSLSMSNSNKRLIVSTHSSSFLMGCIQSGSQLNIVRLTYKNGLPTARILPKDKIQILFRNPLLRSTGVLNGLFYETVIVTESDSDRAFYQEINERLLNQKDSRAINNCLFINAQNKQTVWDIIKPLRELGIPAAGIVDLDMVKDGGQEFTKILNSVFIPVLQHTSLQSQRGSIKDALNKSPLDWKINGGIKLLDPQDKQGSISFFKLLAEYGVFVVLEGELESWLKYIGVTGHGSRWLIDLFSKIGDDPSIEGYLMPSDGDVWEFIGNIKNWAENPVKNGIPD